MLSYYDILGVPQTATQEEIKDAYRSLQKKYHPDVYKGGDVELATERIKQVNEAYSVLSDASKKAEYDQRMFGLASQNSYTQSSNPYGYTDSYQDGNTYYQRYYYYNAPQDDSENQNYTNYYYRRRRGGFLRWMLIFFGLSMLFRFLGFPFFFFFL